MNTPRQVRAIVILDVGDHMAERAQELVQWQAELDEEGIPFYFVADAKRSCVGDGSPPNGEEGSRHKGR